MEHHNYNDHNNSNGSSSSSHGMMRSTGSPSEAFSECMSHLLMSAEELRRSCIQAIATTTTLSSSSSADVKIRQIQPDQVFAWQHGLEDSILPLLDQLARWTADIGANPTSSMEADLFQHCQDKAIAVAQIVLETVIKYFSESALIDQMETTATAAGSSNNDGLLLDDNGEPMDQVLRNVQGSIARITELCLVLIAGSNDIVIPTCGSSSADDDAVTAKQKLDSIKAIVQSYVSYQRQVLRQRCRPAIAKLVQIRKQQQQQQQQQTTPLHHQHQHHHDNDDTDDDDDDYQPRVVVEQHHAAALTVILGQAAALIHPLIVWKMTLQQQIQQQQHHGGGDVNSASMITATTAALYRLCTESISTLDEQTCTLTKTVSDWFYQDRPEVDAYMQKCAASEEENSIPQAELCVLDGLVEEMAYTCQVLARYHALLAAAVSSSSTSTTTSATSKSNNNNTDNASSSSSSSLHVWIDESLHLPQTLDVVVERELIPEWTWKYAALERFLAVQQWQSALTIAAQPVQIVIGTRIFVPSIVEDAQYLSTRALERAASTRSTLAIGTVAHAVSRDVWSTTEELTTTGGVHEALLQERGCSTAASLSEQDESGEGAAAAAKKKNALGDSSSNDFAAALLDALDEDLGSKQHHSSTSPPRSSKTQPQPRHPSAPTSGGFLTSTLLAVGGGGSSGTNPTDQVLLETRLCVLNGVHAAAGACRSLVEFLDALLLDDADDSPAAAALQQPNNTGSSGIHGNDQATAMIHLAREELFRYAKDYDKLLSDRLQDTLTTWCGDGAGTGHAPSVSRSRRCKLCFDELRAFLEGENYNIDAGAMKKAEADERLEHGVVGPLKESLLLQQLSDRCESDVLCQLGQVMVATVVDIVLDCLWSTEKKMTDWGSLLLSKQVRLLQGTFSKILAQDSADASILPSSSGAGPNLIQQWERLSQVCNVLQLEQPAEWLMYLDSSVLSAEELKKTMSLRVDFSRDAIQKVVATAKQRMEELQSNRVTT